MNNNAYLYTYILTLIGGILLVVLEDRAGLFDAITILVGVMFLVPGVLTFLKATFPTRSARAAGAERQPVLMIVSGAASVFGITLIVAPHLFTNLIVYAFGALLIVCGIMQLTNFGAQRRASGLPGWYLATPALCIAIGIVIIVIGAQKILDMLALTTGIVLIVYGINGLIGYIERARLIRKGGVTGKVVNIKQ